MPFICFLHLQRRRPLFRKYVGISSRPSERSSPGGMLILKHGVSCLPNVEQAVIDPSSSCLSSFWQQHNTGFSSGRQRIVTHKCRRKESDSSNMLRVMQSGSLEGSKKLESGLYLVSKWVPNAMNLNSWAIYPVLRETWFSSVKFQKKPTTLSTVCH